VQARLVIRFRVLSFFGQLAAQNGEVVSIPGPRRLASESPVCCAAGRRDSRSFSRGIRYFGVPDQSARGALPVIEYFHEAGTVGFQDGGTVHPDVVLSPTTPTGPW